MEADELHRRERQAFGGAIQWETAFFGWLAAVGLAALLVAMVVGGGVAVGLTELDAGTESPVEELTVGGGAILIAILALAYLAGGYVAARMARFDGMRQGLGVWLLSLFMTLALGVAAWIGGGELNPLESLSLPRIPVDEGPLTAGGAVATAIIAVVSLVSAIAGGALGERFHREVDRAGVEDLEGEYAANTRAAETEPEATEDTPDEQSEPGPETAAVHSQSQA